VRSRVGVALGGTAVGLGEGVTAGVTQPPMIVAPAETRNPRRVSTTADSLTAMLMRVLALVFNAFPVRWQRRFMTAAHERFLVGVTGLGVDRQGRVLLARHRFGAPQWRFLGGFLHRRERVEDALTREIREETGLVTRCGPISAGSSSGR